MPQLEPGKSVGFRNWSKLDSKIYDLAIECGHFPARAKTIAKVVPYLYTNCKDAVTAMSEGHGLLYHGYTTRLKGTEKKEIFFGRPHTKRPPRDTSTEVHIVVNQFMEEAGYQARRDNSIFCINSESVASDYGGSQNVFAIFPLNGFHYTWSPKHRDWAISEDNLSSFHTAMTELTYTIAENIKDYFIELKSNGGVPANLYPELNGIREEILHFRYQGAVENGYFAALHDLRLAIAKLAAYQKSHPGIKLLTSDSQRKINRYLSLMSDPQKAAANFVRTNALFSTHLSSAIKTGHEVLINGTYIAIDNNMYGDVLKAAIT